MQIWGLVFPSLSEFSTVYCDPHSHRLWHSGRDILFGLLTCTLHAAAVAVSLQSCPTLSDPIDGSPPGSPVPGILQARTLEWVAISFSNA